MFNVRLAGEHLYGRWLFTWLSLVMSLMMYFLCSPFSDEMSWMRSWTEIGQFLRIFLPTLRSVYAQAGLSFSMYTHDLNRSYVWCHFSVERPLADIHVLVTSIMLFMVMVGGLICTCKADMICQSKISICYENHCYLLFNSILGKNVMESFIWKLMEGICIVFMLYAYLAANDGVLLLLRNQKEKKSVSV